MRGMFYGCTNFNQPLNEWDVSQVTNMINMFAFCVSFNQPLYNWDVSNVRKIKFIFQDCKLFMDNQNILEWVDKNPDLESEFINNQYRVLLTNYRDGYILK
jgi:surface protein